MKFIGIDIGTRYMGWAVLSDDGLVSGYEKIPSGAYITRMEGIYEWAKRFFPEYVFSPYGESAVGIEDVWVGPNKQTALYLAKSWGILAACVFSYGLPIFAVSPKYAKRALTGNGGASKKDIMQTVQETYRIALHGKGAQDEADAVAVAVATRKLWESRQTNQNH